MLCNCFESSKALTYTCLNLIEQLAFTAMELYHVDVFVFFYLATFMMLFC
jgi:hypothetical protein